MKHEIRGTAYEYMPACKKRTGASGKKDPGAGRNGPGRGSLTDYTMEEFFRFAKETPVEDLYFIREAYRVNRSLLKQRSPPSGVR